MIVIILVAVVAAVAQESGEYNATSEPPVVDDEVAVGASGRIVGGTICPNCPWLASLLVVSGGSRYHRCGGTIISKMLILTAAHCFHPGDQPRDFNVRVGSPDIWRGGQLIEISQIIPHEDYTHQLFPRKDIALIRLSKMITYNKRTQRLSLPSKVFPLNTVVATAGWGLTEYYTATRFYRHVHLKLIDCNPYYFAKGLVCAFGEGKKAWKGDSGGPLYHTGTTQIVGIVSGGNPNLGPGFYTNVSYYKGWIHSKMRKIKTRSCAFTYRPVLDCWLVSLIYLLLFFCVRLG